MGGQPVICMGTRLLKLNYWRGQIPYSGKFSLVQIFAKIPFPLQKKFSRFQFSHLASYCHAPLLSPGLQWTKDLPWETVGRRLPVLDSDTVPSSDRARLQWTKRTCEIFHESKCSRKSSRVQIYFAVLVFAFWSWVAKIAKIWTSRKFSAIRYLRTSYHLI